jgi:hypothetical protein
MKEYNIGINHRSFNMERLAYGLSGVNYPHKVKLGGISNPSTHEELHDLHARQFKDVAGMLSIPEQDRDVLITPNGNNVYLWSLLDENGHHFSPKGLGDVDLTISSDHARRVVKDAKGSGAIVARTSIHYAGGSVKEVQVLPWSGPYGPALHVTTVPLAENGFSFDFPFYDRNEGGDDPLNIISILADDQFLKAVKGRNLEEVVDAVTTLNQRLEKPILITGYLAEALK